MKSQSGGLPYTCHVELLFTSTKEEHNARTLCWHFAQPPAYPLSTLQRRRKTEFTQPTQPFIQDVFFSLAPHSLIKLNYFEFSKPPRFFWASTVLHRFLFASASFSFFTNWPVSSKLNRKSTQEVTPDFLPLLLLKCPQPLLPFLYNNTYIFIFSWLTGKSLEAEILSFISMLLAHGTMISFR